MTTSFIEYGLTGNVEWVRTRGRNPKGMVFTPPLIGGHALQQIRFLRGLRHYDLDLFSFSYTGHGASLGSFSIGASLDNCAHMLSSAIEICGREGLALFGLAGCYAAIPLLHAAQACGEPMQKLVLINAVTHWRLRTLMASFIRSPYLTPRHRISLDRVKTALETYLDELFPGVVRWGQSFGALTADRLNWPRIIKEFFYLRPLKELFLPHTQVLCFYSMTDSVLDKMGWLNRASYEDAIRKVCPETLFKPLHSDHYLTDGRIRSAVTHRAACFFTDARGPAGRRGTSRKPPR